MIVAPRGLLLTAALAAAVAVTGCANAERPSVQADTVVLPTPMRSLTLPATTALRQVESALLAIGERLVEPKRPYRPSEPTGLLQVPRALARADVADADDGFVVIYSPTRPAQAQVLADELATYLGSGFGQTNYPADAQFAVATLGDAVLFTWWSRSRSSDPTRAEAVFDAVSSVGEAVEVRK